MLTTQFFPSQASPQSGYTIFKGERALWELKLSIWKKGGEYITPTELTSLKVPIFGGPVTWVRGARIWESKLFEPFSFAPGSTVNINLVSTIQLVELEFLKKSTRGAVYPSMCRLDEELQLPVSGVDHFIFVMAGAIECSDRQGPKNYQLKTHDLLVVSRTHLKKEYLNLKVWGKAQQSRILWGVLHLADH